MDRHIWLSVYPHTENGNTCRQFVTCGACVEAGPPCGWCMKEVNKVFYPFLYFILVQLNYNNCIFHIFDISCKIYSLLFLNLYPPNITKIHSNFVDRTIRNSPEDTMLIVWPISIYKLIYVCVQHCQG